MTEIKMLKENLQAFKNYLKERKKEKKEVLIFLFIPQCLT